MGELVLQVSVETAREVNVRTPSGSSRVKTLWKVRDVKNRCDTHYDQPSATKIEEAVSQELWNAHFESPTFSLSEALRKVENVGRR